MNINTPLLSVEEMEALRADLQQPKSREAEPVDLASGDHALRRVVPIIERRLELFQSAVELIVARSIRETLTPLSHPPDVIGPRTATGTMRELSMVIEIHTPEFGLVGFVGVEKLVSFLLVERSFGAQLNTGPAKDDNWFVPTRERLSDFERQTLVPLLDNLLVELKSRVFEELEQDLILEMIPGGLPPELPPQVESTIIWKLRFKLGEDNSGFVLVLLPNILELLIRKDRVQAEFLPTLMATHLANTRVQVSAALGQASLSLEDFLNLREGDVVRLDRSQEDLVELEIEGASKMRGLPIQRNGAFAIDVKQFMK